MTKRKNKRNKFFVGCFLILVVLFGKSNVIFSDATNTQTGIQFVGDGSIDVNVVLLVKDKDTAQALPKAVFDLRKSSGEVIKTKLTTDELGKIVIQSLSPGDYEFVQREAPKGYQLATSPEKFSIDFSKTEVKIEVYNEKIKENKQLSTNSKNNPVTQKITEMYEQARKKLPETGTKKFHLLSILGFINIGVVSFFILKRQK